MVWRPQKRGEANPNARLSLGQVRFIKLCLEVGMTHKRIAEIVGCGTSTVGRISTGECWGHVKGWRDDGH